MLKGKWLKCKTRSAQRDTEEKDERKREERETIEQ